MFRPFEQGDSSVSRKYGGTGLGLFLVHRFCQLMGGDISVVSSAGYGARFTVRLPREVTPDAKHAVPAAVPIAS